MQVIAHRGASRRYAENSLLAFRYAVESGADGIEVDLRSSADGILYCFHDPNLLRLTGRSGSLKKLTSSRIERRRLIDGQPILRFDQFVREFGGRTKIVLDIKSAGNEGEIIDQLGDWCYDASIVYSSFNGRIISRIKTLIPKARTALIAGPIRNLSVKMNISTYLKKRAIELGAEAVHISRLLAKRSVIGKMKDAKLRVAVWTVNDPSEAERLAAFGADAIITNVPEELAHQRTSSSSAERAFGIT